MSVVIYQKLWEFGWEVLMHPPYSRDLAPSDYHLFLVLQNFQIDKKLEPREDCENRMLEFFTNKDQVFYERGNIKATFKLLYFAEKEPILPQLKRFQQKTENLLSDCQVIYSQFFGLAIHQNDHQARRRFVEWAQKEIALVPDFHKRILFSDEAHFWLNGYVNKQNCRIWSEANPQVFVETPLHPEKLTVWCALWAG
ncbi:histone-lysine N-methyltransferase SETMAR [Trichonephila clavipes]|nr:histone-lysine N-methyltransferase SETMAR [Trichonephila clavipes]